MSRGSGYRVSILFFTGVVITVLSAMPVFSVFAQAVFGQIEIKGTVYDRSQLYAMQGVSVLASSGAGTMTDSAGHYHIRLSIRDSIYFSYLGKATAKVPVRSLSPDVPFDMSLAADADTMASFLVFSKNYKLDSLQTRKDYAKVFNYGRSYVDNMNMNKKGNGLGVGLDFDLLFFDAGASRRMLAMQKRLEDEEKENYIDHKFSRSVVKRVTGLESPALDTFMRQYRPTYEFLHTFETDYEYFQFISESAKFFSENWKKEHGN